MNSASGSDRTRTQELVARYLEGDRTAEARLFGEHRTWLVEVAKRHRCMPALSAHSTPEDLADEGLLRVLKKGILEKFEDRGPGSLRRLLVSVLDRVMKDASRRTAAWKRGGRAGARLPLDPDTEAETRPNAGFLPSSREPTPTGAARASEIVEWCRRVLSPSEWAVWRLSELEGLDSEEIARRVGSTAGSVRSKLRRIRGRLVRALASPGDAARADPR